jgi:hypothetical protein
MFGSDAACLLSFGACCCSEELNGLWLLLDKMPPNL